MNTLTLTNVPADYVIIIHTAAVLIDASQAKPDARLVIIQLAIFLLLPASSEFLCRTL